MSNKVITPKTDKSGLYKHGYYHSEGGIQVFVDGVKEIEVEKDEYKICRGAYNSDKIYDFKGKTNLEVLDALFKDAQCTFKTEYADSGDFILCRPVVYDRKKHNRKGTVKEILNQMQSEKSCRVENGDDSKSKGGELTNKGWFKGMLSFLNW